MIVYGIKNCDTVKKALTWLKAKKIDVQFHDYKTEGITEAKLKAWSQQVGWESLLNKKGTTWRRLDEATQAAVTNESAAIQIMMNNTSIIKRPLIEKRNQVVIVGFDEAVYSQKLK